jgi:hypothetical protein
MQNKYKSLTKLQKTNKIEAWETKTLAHKYMTWMMLI